MVIDTTPMYARPVSEVMDGNKEDVRPAGKSKPKKTAKVETRIEAKDPPHRARKMLPTQTNSKTPMMKIFFILMMIFFTDAAAVDMKADFEKMREYNNGESKKSLLIKQPGENYMDKYHSQFGNYKDKDGSEIDVKHDNSKGDTVISITQGNETIDFNQFQVQKASYDIKCTDEKKANEATFIWSFKTVKYKTKTFVNKAQLEAIEKLIEEMEFKETLNFDDWLKALPVYDEEIKSELVGFSKLKDLYQSKQFELGLSAKKDAADQDAFINGFLAKNSDKPQLLYEKLIANSEFKKRLANEVETKISSSEELPEKDFDQWLDKSVSPPWKVHVIKKTEYFTSMKSQFDQKVATLKKDPEDEKASKENDPGDLQKCFGNSYFMVPLTLIMGVLCFFVLLYIRNAYCLENDDYEEEQEGEYYD